MALYGLWSWKEDKSYVKREIEKKNGEYYRIGLPTWIQHLVPHPSGELAGFLSWVRSSSKSVLYQLSVLPPTPFSPLLSFPFSFLHLFSLRKLSETFATRERTNNRKWEWSSRKCGSGEEQIWEPWVSLGSRVPQYQGLSRDKDAAKKTGQKWAEPSRSTVQTGSIVNWAVFHTLKYTKRVYHAKFLITK